MQNILLRQFPREYNLNNIRFEKGNVTYGSSHFFKILIIPEICTTRNVQLVQFKMPEINKACDTFSKILYNWYILEAFNFCYFRPPHDSAKIASFKYVLLFEFLNAQS